MNNTIFIILAIYVGLDIILGLWLYIHIRCKGWRRWDIAVNFRNLLRMHNRAFKETIAEQVGYADYNETYRNGYDNGFNNGYDEGYDNGYNDHKKEIENKPKATPIPSLFSLLFSLLG